MVVGVLVELSNKNIDKEFFYSVPKELEEEIKVGIRVEIPFGPQKLEGFVTKIKSTLDETIKDIKFKDILNIVDKEIVLNEELLTLGKKMQEKTIKPVKEMNKTIQDLKMELETIKKSQKETTLDLEKQEKTIRSHRCKQASTTEYKK